MAEKTGIEWCDATFNPWRGCTKVSPGCENCYAEKMSARNPKVLGEWGPNGTRVIASKSYWRQPLKWDRQAQKAGVRRRVFCASLADWLEERPDLTAMQCRLLRLIHLTPHLDWLLLTKRIDAFGRRMEACASLATGSSDPDVRDGAELARQWERYDVCMPHVWLGVSVEDQRHADERIPALLRTPAAVRFLSVEPLLGPVRLDAFLCGWGRVYESVSPFGGRRVNREFRGPNWVIIGGESGSHARPCHVEWVRDLVRQCQESGVPCFVKQLGSRPILASHPTALQSGMDVQKTMQGFGAVDGAGGVHLADPKGGDPAEYPEDLRVREFPR